MGFAAGTRILRRKKSTLGLDQSFTGPYASWKNVKTDYGAVGNGVADDTTAIQTALTALKTTSTNAWSTLYFPSGTYLITSQLVTARATTHPDSDTDYNGAQLIGQDPTNTIIKWGGAAGGTMLHWDAQNDKVSRLQFEGSGTAANAIERSDGGFSTYSEMSDLQIQNVTGVGIKLGSGAGNGNAEIFVTRNRFYQCNTSLLLWNFNTLDIYVWHNYFQGSQIAIRVAVGVYQAYDNRFVGSTATDLAGGAGVISVVNNTSLGSRSFAGNAQDVQSGLSFQGNGFFQGNKVYNPSGVAFDLDLTSPQVMIDNLVASSTNQILTALPGAYSFAPRAFMSGNTYATNNPWPMRQPDLAVIGVCDAGHPISAATDGNPATYAAMFMQYVNGCGVIWNAPLGTAPTITSYAITGGGSYVCGGDVQDWALRGSNDWGHTWATIDTRAGETFTSSGQRKVYTVATPGAYAIYKLEVLKNSVGNVEGGAGTANILELELMNISGTNLATDPNSLTMNAIQSWGDTVVDQQSVVSPSSVTVPSSLAPFEFEPYRAATIFDVAAFTGAAIQTAINLAAAAGGNPVVHLPKGSYNISSTIIVPANVKMTIVGDGASQSGSVFAWQGPGTGPVLWLQGPNRATVQDVYINGFANGADGILIDNANQTGGRVYGYEVFADANNIGAGQAVNLAFNVSNMTKTHVDFWAGGMKNFFYGVRASGGSSHVQFLMGSSGQGQRNWDVRDGSSLIATAWWYEFGAAYTFLGPIVGLTSPTSSGNIALSSMQMEAEFETFPILLTQDFIGTVSFMVNDVNQAVSGSEFWSFTGDGSQTTVLAVGDFVSPTLVAADITGADVTSPDGQISQFLPTSSSATLPNITNKVSGVFPSHTLITNALALQRTIETKQAVAGPAGVTDVKLLRIYMSSGTNRDAVTITGTP